MNAHTTTQPVHPPVVEYERAAISPERMQVRRESETLVVTIPPPDLWRLIASHALGTVLLSLLICAVVVVSVLSHSGSAMVLGYVAGVTLVVLLSSSLLRLIRVARFGRRPAVLRASPDELSATLPLRERGRPKRLPAVSIADLWVRQGGLAPAFLPFIRLRVALTDEREELILVPYRGNEPLAIIEENLRDVLRLRPASVSVRLGSH